MDTTDYWYSVKKLTHHANYSDYHHYYSTSWCRVSDFYSYWKQNGRSSVWKMKYNKLAKKIKIGDIVQLYNGKTWNHSIIISCRKEGIWCYASHTNDCKDKKITELKKPYSNFRIIRPK